MDDINLNEIIKYTELLRNDIELDADGNLKISQINQLCEDENKKRILLKLLINELKENEVILTSGSFEENQSEKRFICPWVVPSYDLTNLMNQYCIFNLITKGKKSDKKNTSKVEIMEKDSWKFVNWDVFNSTTSKHIDLLFNNFVIEKLNEYKFKIKQYKSNMISIKQVRRAEKSIGNIYSGFITSVQSYGFLLKYQI